MKKIITLLATLAIVACAFVGCGEEAKSAKYTVVCTVFPQYDWVREIVGENDDIEIKLLSDGGVRKPMANTLFSSSFSIRSTLAPLFLCFNRIP